MIRWPCWRLTLNISLRKFVDGDNPSHSLTRRNFGLSHAALQQMLASIPGSAGAARVLRCTDEHGDKDDEQ